MLPSPVIVCLPTADRRRSYDFYGGGLGLPTVGEIAEDGVPEPLQVVLNDGLWLMLIPTGGFGWTVAGRSVAEPGTVECQLALRLAGDADVDAFVDRARGAGAEIVSEPSHKEWAYAANFADPDGHLWMVLAAPPGQGPFAAETSSLVRTRRQLHGIAECLLAGPEHRDTGEIALRVAPGGFETSAGPARRLAGTELVTDDRRIPAAGTYADLAARLGVEFGRPDISYPDGSGARADDVVDLDPQAARVLTDWFELGDAALRRLDPGLSPILWPEHFDVAIELDGHSFGVSPGDDDHPTPYAYVSHRGHADHEYWNVPFGALRDLTEVRSADDLVDFWTEGRRLLNG
jgi:predicted lactoylglutathione lyase